MSNSFRWNTEAIFAKNPGMVKYLSNAESHGFCSGFESAVLKQMQNREFSAQDGVLLEVFRSEMQEDSSSDDFATKLLNISPEHLETQLFLHINESYWNVNTIQSLL